MWKLDGGKHGPNRLRNYLSIHETIMRRFVDHGFVESDGVEVSPVPGGIRIEGELACLGGIVIEVRKELAFLDDDPDPLVRNAYYSYNVGVKGLGPIFRYDSPHLTHRPEHHVHRYDPFDQDAPQRVDALESDEECPTLAEVVEEAQAWYYENMERLEVFPR